MIEYAVRCIFPDQSLVEPYIEWLTEGHIQDLLDAGAVSGYAVLETEPDDVIAVTSRYLFPSREIFDRYLSETAPRLRKEGLAKFGPQMGTVMNRTVGTVFPTK